jgi:hypothetical protein
MARQRKERASPSIKLSQPDRSAPTEKTLLDLAQERNLFEQARQREQERKAAKASSKGNASNSADDDDVPDPAVLSPGAERYLESFLWVSTLAMLHFTLDVLVHSQYGVEIKWDSITKRTAIAWPGEPFSLYSSVIPLIA